jgi:rhamnulokinase
VRIDAVHIVGGGALNEVLCQLTADACGVVVHAGPVEAAAIGNALMQMHGLGEVQGDLWSMRRLVATSFGTSSYQPRTSHAAEWAEAEARLSALRSPG